jgi:hypothetical protein
MKIVFAILAALLYGGGLTQGGIGHFFPRCEPGTFARKTEEVWHVST